ncbi:MAG TPA: PAS domain S-box protein [Gemmata sp.]|nr:PAS domain S-box protein [Gemmata sp.]
MQQLQPTEPVATSDPGNDLEFRSLLERLPAAAYTCDAEGRITYFNRRAAEYWGREPKLNDPAERFCGWFKLFSPDGTPISRDLCRMAIALRDQQDYDGQEIVIERPDGTRLTVLAHASPLPDRSGHVRGAVNVLVDITDRKRDEQVHALLAAIVQSSQDAIISKTLDGTIRSWNTGAEHLFGYSAAEAIGRSITLIIPPERLDEEQMILDKLRRGERIEHYETVRVSKEGRRIAISLTISPLRDGSGRVVGASKVARDITLQKQAEEMLRDSDRRKTEFLAVLAHELRNPLAPLRNSLQVAILAGDDWAAMEEAHAVMDRQLDHLVRLVDDLLDLSRITKGKIELRKERIELASAVRDAVEASRPLIEASGHELAVTLPAGPVWVEGDRMRLAQVFSNLLNNSARYTDRGGRIALRVERSGRETVVTVSDNGVGIPADAVPNIFEMFTQADRGLERSRGGLGIGLSLVRGLVELHGGWVEARSEGPGKGSEFAIHLPCAPAPAVKPRLSSPDPQGGPSFSILVVDDNTDSADSLAAMLELMGHTTRTAYDGLAGVEAAAEVRPEVVLLDIGLPRLNGYEACRRIRREPWGERMVLIAQTGWGQEEDRNRAKEAGFYHHLVKPIAPAALRTLLAGLAPAR